MSLLTWNWEISGGPNEKLQSLFFQEARYPTISFSQVSYIFNQSCVTNLIPLKSLSSIKDIISKLGRYRSNFVMFCLYTLIIYYGSFVCSSIPMVREKCHHEHMDFQLSSPSWCYFQGKNHWTGITMILLIIYLGIN